MQNNKTTREPVNKGRNESSAGNYVFVLNATTVANIKPKAVDAPAAKHMASGWTTSMSNFIKATNKGR